MRTYTFHVTLPQHKGISRKVELPAEATLEWLHFAIQDAYNFNADHLYSFFMSGKAWDESSEYTLPEDVDPWDGSPFGEEEGDDDDDDDDVFTEATGLPPGMPAGLEMPTPDQLRGMMQILRSDPQAREQFMQAMSAQTGLPPMMVQMLIGNMESALGGMSDAQMNELLQMGNPFGDDEDGGEDDEEEDAAGDVRTTKLAALNLHKGQNFLYLFDYGDEWRFNVRVHAINENGDPDAEYPRLIESVGTAPQQYPDDEGEDEWDDEETAE